MGVRLPVATSDIKAGDQVKLALFRGDDEYEFDTEVTMVRDRSLGLRFKPMTPQQSIDFVQATFARADSWVVWGDKRKMDKPLASLKQIFHMSVLGLGILVDLVGQGVRGKTAVLLNRPRARAVVDSAVR